MPSMLSPQILPIQDLSRASLLLQVRFASHVFPGETLRIEAWRQQEAGDSGSSMSSDGGSSEGSSNRGGGSSSGVCSGGSGSGGGSRGGSSIKVVFRASTVQRGRAVLTHAAVQLVPVQQNAKL